MKTNKLRINELIRVFRRFLPFRSALKMRYWGAVGRAKIVDLTFHDLRHVATSRLATLYPNPPRFEARNRSQRSEVAGSILSYDRRRIGRTGGGCARLKASSTSHLLRFCRTSSFRWWRFVPQVRIARFPVFGGRIGPNARLFSSSHIWISETSYQARPPTSTYRGPRSV
jgi:hypothetical protein